jgi:uncharacterized protein YdeI (YjbR/CyaY-like superfamily)
VVSFPEIYFQTRVEWRAWLTENHNLSKGVWLLFFKKEAGKPCMTYDEAVEEALCFGWIDGIIKNLDEEKYVRKIMPRTNLFNWSPSNRKRVGSLIESGLMTEIGLSKIGDYSKTGKLTWPEDKTEQPNSLSLTPGLIEMLKQNQMAYSNCNNLSSSHQKQYIMWIMSAKQEETRQKRMKEAIPLLEKNHKNLIK